MSIRRIIAIVVVYVIACLGWTVLGTTTSYRSSSSGERLGRKVERIFGGPIVQRAPRLVVPGGPGEKDRPASLDGSGIRVHLDLDHRRKGLIWYPTYRCRFAGEYRISRPASGDRLRLHFDFPVPDGTYENFLMTLAGEPVRTDVDTAAGAVVEIPFAPGEAEKVFTVAYATRGLGEWRYDPGADRGMVRNLDVEVTTDFVAVDFPDDAMSPSEPPAPLAADGSAPGQLLRWRTGDLLTRQHIAVTVPEKLNPGPLASRITFFAPVCLGFFFLVLATITIVRRVPIHPMHYLFVAGGFFAFHLLLAYLVDVLPIHLAFVLGALASVVLVLSYLRAALGKPFPVLVAGLGQVFFLVLFSYSFFFEGLTGLTVALGSVVTLAILMRVTARVDWYRCFRQPAGALANQADPVEA